MSFRDQDPWIQYGFSKGKQKARMYTLTSGKTEGADPKSWVLKGSNDGKKWTVLDERKDEKFQWRLYTRVFEIEKPGSYSLYRLEFTDDNIGGATSLGEVEFLSTGTATVR